MNTKLITAHAPQIDPRDPTRLVLVPTAVLVPAVEQLTCDMAGAAARKGISVEAMKKRVQRHQLPKGCVVRSGDRVEFVIARLGGSK